MKIGIIGSGIVGQTLAVGFLKHGHEVAIGTRDPGKLKEWSAKHKGAVVKSFAEAAVSCRLLTVISAEEYSASS